MDNSIYASFLIPEYRLDGLEKLINKLARKISKGKTSAEKPEIEATREVVMIKDKGQLVPYNPAKHTGEHDFYGYVWVTLKYEQPKLNGWQLVAVYDWEVTEDGHETCYTSMVPGQMMPDMYRDVAFGECDHCNTKRRRKQSMLVTKGHIEFKVVGSTCIKDFLGHHNPKTLMEIFSFETTLGEWCGERNPGETHKLALDNVVDVLTLAAMYAEQQGYVKANEWGGKLPTAHSVSSYMHDASEYWKEERRHNKPTEDHRKQAEKAIEWGKAQAIANDGEPYWDNMGKALEAGAITGKRFGLVCSLMYSYFLAEERRKRELRLSEKTNEYVGMVGERLRNLEATVIRVRPSYGYYGDQTIVNLETPDGNTFVWFASGNLDIEKGEYWKFDATVKKHSEYKGVRQTQVTRVKYTDIDEKKSEAA